MEFLIVTGLSGAGKSRTIDALEDIGFYCVDNMPPSFIPKFYQLCTDGDPGFTKVAVVTDIRGGVMFNTLMPELDQLKKDNKAFKIMFLDADDETLINRFKETRRKHPLAEKYLGAISDAVAAERSALQKIRERADYLVDTSKLSPVQLKQRICSMFTNDENESMSIHCISFGFKNGLPPEADIVFDVRFLPNPFYIDELKDLTGLDREVNEYVMGFEQTKEFLKKMTDMIDFLLPHYAGEGKSQLVIAIGCTGGKHRSVAVAQYLYDHICRHSHNVGITHRDIIKK